VSRPANPPFPTRPGCRRRSEKGEEPLTDAAHVRTALARFDQVTDVTDAERDRAFANIRAAARHYDVEVAEDDWRQLGRRPHTPNPAH
jgi:hypothetical protein